jgi:FMN phosphatase YigB (HAD superfamily)
MHMTAAAVPAWLIDFDDTLVDYRNEERIALDALTALAETQLRAEPAAFRHAYRAARRARPAAGGAVGASTYSRAERIDAALRALGIEASAGIIDALVDAYWDARLSNVNLLDGAVALLRALRPGTLILCTDGDAQQQRRRIRRSGLDAFFDTILISGERGYSKRNLRALLGSAVSEGRGTAMISDLRDPDLVQARALGFTTIWLDRDDTADCDPVVDVRATSLHDVAAATRELRAGWVRR